MSAPLLRALRPADRAALEAMVRATERFPEPEVAVALELVDLGLSEDAKGYLFVVAEREGHVAGYACWGRAAMSPGVFDLYWIVVDPRAQGGGVGQALLAHAEREVRREEGHTLLIETEGSALYAAARRFYLAAGYVEAGRIADYYGPGKDKVLYTKRLDRS
ncbi:MAG: GNAT family N-acetyltransferase [Sandaracinus sp.]